ncbi:MAG TPA: hypothetical protein PKG54_13485 [Phycisphaerae bacterium]|nr:hypothetical protein [Phycisphaerae bacterium]HOB75524.1 hypothetical protein [Phycisphaerae bacterium]HOJ55885.1 hypothetical protein [Phycisphaerae bacterium]HPP21556.1 hypothetical protein [Phycisphaerae bacterium]HPU33623.1 hypothetical protein [Phycisphaerae bacterium]
MNRVSFENPGDIRAASQRPVSTRSSWFVGTRAAGRGTPVRFASPAGSGGGASSDLTLRARLVAGRCCQVLLLLVLMVTVPGLTCRNVDTRPVMADFDLPSGPPKSLRATFDHLRDAYQRRAYLALRPYMDPAHRDQVIDMLLAVDDLLAANAAVLKAIDTALPDAPGPRPDISGVIMAHLELFSRDVRIVEEHEDRQAGQAIIRIEIANTPPPVDVHFRLREGHWVYVPGATGGPATIHAFRELTKALDRTARSLTTSEDLSPRQVLDDYRLFVLPMLNRMAQTLASR